MFNVGRWMLSYFLIVIRYASGLIPAACLNRLENDD